MSGQIPEYCDFDCPHANFPPADTAGICRTMSAVWCGKLKELTNKNAPCEFTARQKKNVKPKKTPARKKASSKRKK